ncbi:MAG: hypothetical protein AAF468_08880 [Pseudomonadota bacterium]
MELPVETSVSRDNFIHSPGNDLACRFLWSWPDWRAQSIVLVGPAGSGKSHLGAIWKADAKAVEISAGALSDADPAELGRTHVLVDDVTPDAFDPVKLFHLLNALRQSGRSGLFLSRTHPNAWQVELDDLSSRLRALTVFELAAPDDDMLRQVLVKLFSDRQLRVDPSLIAFLVTRMERSVESANRLVEFLDRETLARNCKPSRALAAEALAALGQG